MQINKIQGHKDTRIQDANTCRQAGITSIYLYAQNWTNFLAKSTISLSSLSLCGFFSI